jgi:putative flavoprotein involved in K+ transport
LLAETETTLAEVVEHWLERLGRALAAADEAQLRRLFHAESYWRDLLALTWEIETTSGAAAIAGALQARAREVSPRRFALAPGRTPPRRVTRAGTSAIEAIFHFETDVGRGSGVLRLTAAAGDSRDLRAWTLLTALDAMRGHEEQVGHARPNGQSYVRDFRGPNWLDRRMSAAQYADRDPAVLVAGGGQAGLSIAARLNMLQVDTLVVDRWPRIGDNWRQRYHALTLHNQVHVNHLPYMPFPPSWPTYIPKDKLAGWLEAYVDSLEINYWPATELVNGAYDEAERRWSVVLRRADGTTREMHPRHVVMATGVSGIPNLPDIPGLENFAGTVQHSSQYGDGEAWAGKSAIVVGTGNSGHDIAQDLYSSGAQVTLVQRSPTQIVNIEPSAQLPYALYDEGPPLEDCDLIAASFPLPLARRSHQALTAKARELDKALLDGLERVGFRLDYGEDGTGWQFKYLTRGGGYYFNVGCSDLVADRKIRLVQLSDIAELVAGGARLASGGTIPAHLLVLATGYKGQEDLVARLFGEAVAARVGPIWGFGDGMELRNMFVRTPQPGLWFIAGSLAQCRIYSKYLALQIKACEAGLLGGRPCRTDAGAPAAGASAGPHPPRLLPAAWGESSRRARAARGRRPARSTCPRRAHRAEPRPDCW